MATTFVVLLSACRAASPTAIEVIGSAAASPRVTPAASPRPAPNAGDRPAGVDAISHARYLPMWRKPRGGDPDFVFDVRSPNGGRAPMLVEDRRTIGDQRWVRILLPVRPNGASAWSHVEDVTLVPRHQEIVVDLSTRTLRRYVDGRLENRFRVGVGTPQTPTGVGTFYVWQRVRFADPYGPYGIFALGLSGFSPVLSDWPGGGRMAIHGSADPSDRGRMVSHGCIRVYNPELRALMDVPLGTPVVIRR